MNKHVTVWLSLALIGAFLPSAQAEAVFGGSQHYKLTTRHSSRHVALVPPPPATMPSPIALAMLQSHGAAAVSMPAPPPVPLVKKLKLLGIICDTAILSGPTGCFRLRPGEQREEVRFVALKNNAVTLTQKDDTVVLQLN